MSTTNAVKDRIIDWIDDAIGGFSTVEWTVNVSESGERPFSTVKFGKQTINEMTYNNSVPEQGVFMETPFTVKITDVLERQYPQLYPPNHHAMDAGDVLIDYLYKSLDMDIEKTNYKIYKVYDLSMGEWKDRSTVRNRRMGSVVISGKLLVKYLD